MYVIQLSNVFHSRHLYLFDINECPVADVVGLLTRGPRDSTLTCLYERGESERRLRVIPGAISYSYVETAITYAALITGTRNLGLKYHSKYL